MEAFAKVDSETLIPVRMIVRDADNSNAAVSNTTAVDVPLSALLAGGTPAAAAGSTGVVTRQAAQADSVAADVAALRTDFNALLAKLRSAGILAT